MMDQVQPVVGFRAKYTDNGIVFENKSTRKLIYGAEILNMIYSPEYLNAPYTDTEYHQDWKSFISLCLTSAVAYKSYCSHNMNTEGFVPNLPRTFMNCNEAINHISCYPSILKLPQNCTNFLEEAFSYIKSREAVTEASEIIPRPMQIMKFMNLSCFAYFALHCTLICRLDRGFESVFKVLEGESGIRMPILGIIQELYSFAFPNQDADWLLDQASLENRLLFSSTSEFDLMRSLNLRPAALSYILGKPYKSRELSSYIIKFSDKNIEPLYLNKQIQAAYSSFEEMILQKKPFCVF